MSQSKRISLWLSAPGLAVAALLAVVFLSEWVRVAVIADSATVESYHFGSEAMVGHGGWPYRTAALYARTSLVGGLVALVVTGAFVVAVVRRSRVLALVAYGLLVVGLAANQVMR